MVADKQYPGTLIIRDQVAYRVAWELQHALVQQRVANQCLDTLVLLEHPPVFTVGRRGHAAHWGGEEGLRLAPYPVYHVERGGSVTYHGPGQIVGYPILRLNRFCAGPKAYVHLLEEVLIRTLSSWSIQGRRVDRLPGVWVGQESPAKIAAIGVRILHGVTMHGFALNVTVDLEPFSRIVPCGIPQCRVTSMADLLGRPLDLETVREQLAADFANVFGLEWTTGESAQLASERLLAQGFVH